MAKLLSILLGGLFLVASATVVVTTSATDSEARSRGAYARTHPPSYHRRSVYGYQYHQHWSSQHRGSYLSGSSHRSYRRR